MKFNSLILGVAAFVMAVPSYVSAQDSQQTASVNADQPVPKRFPRVVDLGGSTVTIFEPQIDGHENYRKISGWSAVSLAPAGDGKAMVGALKFEADVVADFDERMVTIYDRRIVGSYFPELTDRQAETLGKRIQAAFVQDPSSVPLDVMLAYFADADDAAKSVQVSLTPPSIFYSAAPAFLVVFDGEPRLVPVKQGSSLKLAVNTNWDVFFDTKKSLYYLRLGSGWLKADDVAGPWSRVRSTPKALKDLPEEARFADARAAVPGKKIKKSEVPLMMVTTEPAELIVTDGEARLEDVESTPLAFVANSSSDIVYHRGTERYYYLVAGRWFKAGSIEGPWEAAAELPAEFADIPADHPRAHVRASVPGTLEANFAVREASVPKTAVVSKSLDAPEIRYDGDTPKFEPISSTTVSRATNTPYDVFLVGSKYYLCYQAVWFVSDRPTGSWAVAASVPDAIYTIPASSPAHNVTYVHIYETHPTTVHVGYTSGYHHSYVSFGVVVYGSGYYYGPNYYDPFYYGWPPYYYHGYPYSYGSASFYNPVTGTYGHGHFSYGPYGGTWQGERYNPRTGRYGEGKASWDYNSGVYKGESYNPRNDVSTKTRQEYKYDGKNEYESWGETKVERGDDWVKSERYTNQDGSRIDLETSRGGEGAIVSDGDRRGSAFKTGDGDLYVGAEGNVFRQTEGGGWEKRDGGEWNSVDTSQARERAAQVTPEQRQAVQNRASQASPAERTAVRNNAAAYLADRDLSRSGAARDRSDAGRSSQRTTGDNSWRYTGSRDGYQRLNQDARARNYGNERYQRYQSYRSQSGRNVSRGQFSGTRGGGRRR